MSNLPALVMSVVAATDLALAIFVATRAVTTEAGVYRRRIGATMLGASGVVLAVFAYALWSWGPAR